MIDEGMRKPKNGPRKNQVAILDFQDILYLQPLFASFYFSDFWNAVLPCHKDIRMSQVTRGHFL